VTSWGKKKAVSLKSERILAAAAGCGFSAEGGGGVPFSP